MDCNSQASKQQQLCASLPLNIQGLPIELLSMVLRNLAFQDVDEYPGTDWQLAIEESYKDLRSLCLVSKAIDAVARPILYEKTLVFRCTNLVALYRTLLCNEMLGRYIKHLALNAVFRWYRPGKRPPNYSRLPLSSLQGLDADLDYWQEYWRKPRAAAHIRYGVVFSLYLKVINRALNVQVLSMNTIPRPEDEDFERRRGSRGHPPVAKPELSELPNLRVVRRMGETGPVLECPQTELGCLLPGRQRQPSLEGLVWIEGWRKWLDSLPYVHGRSSGKTYLSQSSYQEFKIDKDKTHTDTETNWRCDTFKVFELKNTACLPMDITNICESFPNLRTLSVTSYHLRTSDRLRLRGDSIWPETWSVTGARSLTSTLAKMQHLEVLRLDLYHERDISFAFGSHRILNLSMLPRLQELTIPVHFFVLIQLSLGPESVLKTVDPCLVLPRPLRRLTLSVDVDCLWEVLCSDGYFPHTIQDVVLQVMENLLPLCGRHLLSLNDITYSYTGDSAKVEDGTSCTCVEEKVRCHYHYRVYCSSLLTSSLDISEDVLSRFKALVDQFGKQNVHLKEEDMMGEGVDGCEADYDNPVWIS